MSVRSRGVDVGARAVSRRRVLAGAVALAGAALSARRAEATPESMAAAIREATGGAEAREGRVKIEIPAIAENGNSVPVKVAVDSPMTEANHVTGIHIFSERNPAPNVISFRLGPRAGKAVVSTRMRLATTQTVVAVAAMSDGTFWRGQEKVLVTLGACVEGE